VTQKQQALDLSSLKPLNAAGLAKARQILAAGRHLALKRAGYFGPLILKLVIRETPMSPGFNTVAVTDRLVMLACMEYVATLTPELMAGEFAHEVGHVFLKHLARRGHRNPDRWNRAGDLTLYTIVRDMGFQQVPWALQPVTYGFKEHEATDAYYALLEELDKKGAKKGQGGQGPGQGQPGKQPQVGTGWCGSCAGHAVPGEPAAGSDPDERSPSDVEVAVRDAAEAIKAAATRSRGSVPAGLLLMVDELLSPPKVPWQQTLRQTVRGAIAAWASGAGVDRYNRPSRHQASIGWGPGRPILAVTRRPMPRVKFAVDSSGSMGAGEGSPLAAACAEVMGVVRALSAAVDLVVCDAAVHTARKVGTIPELLASVKGGGGTDFRPIFENVEASRPRPSVVIVATDGYGPAPKDPPRGVRVIWLLIGKDAPKPAPWGDVVRIEE
jgi:predicted metal-dependent peptidase